MGLLAFILCCASGVQTITPLVAGSFIDQATSGAAQRDTTLTILSAWRNANKTWRRYASSFCITSFR